MTLEHYGFIDQSGKYYTCGYMEHLGLAKRICMANNYEPEIKKYASDFITRLDYEEYLFAKGYLKIASRYVAHGCRRSTVINHHHFPFVHLSEVQKQFIKDNLNNAYNSEMLESMEEVLEYDDYVEEQNKILQRIYEKPSA